jgi:hypothetical protein
MLKLKDTIMKTDNGALPESNKDYGYMGRMSGINR